MSLLLDALKKAADEKKKDSAAGQSTEPSASTDPEQQEQAVDLDLELAHEEEPEFPQVHEEIVRPVEIPERVNDKKEVPPLNEPEVELVLESVDETESVTKQTQSQQPKSIDSDSEASKVLVDDEQEDLNQSTSGLIKEELQQADQEPMGSSHASTDRNEAQQYQRQKVEASERRHQQDQDALAVLINKNTEHRNRHRRMINITVLAGLLAVLSGATIYGYYMLDAVQARKQVVSTVETKQTEQAVKKTGNGDKTKTATVRSSPAENAIEKNVVSITRAKADSHKSGTTNPPIANKTIQIKKRTREDPVGVLLAQAYAAFKQSEYTHAESLYDRVIKRDQNNRDALLGLAAIAVKQGRLSEAQVFYKRLLILDPKDSFAKAGLSALMDQSYARFNESQIKLMLREQPNAAHLYFALGNLYLNQKRYAEAQGAFFNAWSMQKSNTDYAYNLAVSLDHLGKPQHAMDYYQLSLKLFEQSGGNVMEKDVKKRIKLIQEQIK